MNAKATRDLSRLAVLKSDPASTAATLAGVFKACRDQWSIDLPRARNAFVEIVRINPRLVMQLFDEDEIGARANNWFTAEMRRGAIQPPRASLAPNPIADGGQIQHAHSGQRIVADVCDPIGGQTAPGPDDVRVGQRADAEEAKWRLPDTNVAPIRAERANDWMPSKANPSEPAPARTPSPVAIAAARQGAAMDAATVFDSFRVRGQPIGDIRIGDLKRLRATNLHEAAVLRMVHDRVAANLGRAPETLVRIAIGVSDLERMIQEGAREADAD